MRKKTYMVVRDGGYLNDGKLTLKGCVKEVHFNKKTAFKKAQALANRNNTIYRVYESIQTFEPK